MEKRNYAGFCKNCNGTGQLPISQTGEEALRAIRANPGLSGAQLSRKLRIDANAMHQRLLVLEARHKVTGIHSGNKRLWYPILEVKVDQPCQ